MEEKQKNLEIEIKKMRNNLSTDRLDMSYGEIISMYDRDDIIINPDFQRLFRWDDSQKTRFIESILLGIPIPPIFVAEDDEGRWELVDGLQRVSTILSFFGLLKDEFQKSKNFWVLEKGDLINEFEGMRSSDLPILFQRNIKRTYCRVEILKWDSKMDMRYELFNRLNTGGASLTEQEIRNCIFRGISSEFNNYLDRLSKNTKFIELMNISKQKQDEAYLEELVLRITSLYNNWSNVSTKNMSKHMTKFMENAVSNGFDYSLEDIFNKAVNLLYPLGYGIFRFTNNQLSTSLVDAIFIMTMNHIDYFENDTTNMLESKIVELKQDEEFRKYVGSNSSSKVRVAKRLDRAREIFEVG